MKNKKNGKVVKLTESDLQRIVKRVLTEGKHLDNGFKNSPPESLSRFTTDELKSILDNTIQYSDSTFNEDWEVEDYLEYRVAMEDPELFKSLVGWMKDEYPFTQRIFTNFNELVTKGYFLN
jgi:hypothetical protein|tara:strand:+ start:387 stop:749 length:363 start_codon:yes stop_codon:yes gene_type:complete